jgi:protein-S-isoprenylcysteine O-methyltransferase Ste14
MDSFYDYFQITALITFTSLVWGRALYEKLHGIDTISLLRNRGIERALGIIVVTIINLWVAILVLNVTHPEIRFFPSPLDYPLVEAQSTRITGLVIIVLGFVIYVNAWKTLGNRWRIGHDEKACQYLVKHGAYSISRNPIYLFYDVYFFGTFLINGTGVFLILAISLFITIHHLILEEERVLAIRHGQDYQEYRAHTGRYFTFRKAGLPLIKTLG